MAHDHHSPSATACPSCECQPFSRNAYWTGKLMLARDFVDEQHYVVEKLRHHNQHLHGMGVACGLKVVPHDVEACRKYFVCVEPGSAIDCCGHDIVVCDRQCIDLRTFPALKKLFDAPDRRHPTLRVCIRYRECPTEDIPVLYDECGCDDDRCAPNRILESYSIDVEIVDGVPDEPKPPDDCCELWKKPLDGCPHCDQPDCVVLATIADWVPGAPIVAQAPPPPGSVSIDNLTHRHMLPSVQAIAEFLDCLKLCEPGGGGGGGQGEPGKGIDKVTATFVDCKKPGSATIVEGPPRTLVLEIPKGCDGDDGKPGDPGPGLEPGLTRIRALSWTHKVPVAKGALAKIDMGPNERPQLGVVIAFTNRVVRKSVDSEHVFQVLVTHDEMLLDRLPLRCRCPIDGQVIAVENLQMSGPLIVGATATADPQPEALAFIFGGPNREMPPEGVVELLNDRELWIMLRCDFVIDRNGKAVDGEHLRGALLSGDRPAPPDPAEKFGIQGGLFESWFTLSRG
jgi:hypothetical protein